MIDTTLSVLTNQILEAVQMEGYVKISQAAKILDVSPRTVNRWLHKGYFPGTIKNDPMAETGSPYYIPSEAIVAFQEKRKISPKLPEDEDSN